ncbi:NACHT domain-containing protein [Streptomyces sp. AK02-01A]|uniref:NACHT domain-containing protein n=1 Tax=Streptomyces sp. AK02-01A TaxID=3028648 RepID=UPI0029BB7027|nr:NACHT domain-containing protein [Streptomyces sp. AK02-01A]MDX3850241.1 NACHT domain-containing protein [Streptomyces sp. AK02-01A]
MGTARHMRWGWLALTVVAVGVAVTMAVRAGTGEVDPGGLVVGLVSLLLAIAGLHQATLSQAWQDTDTAGLADRLADVIRKREEEARQRLLGGSDRTINVTFAFLPSPAHHATGAASHGTLEDIATYYRALRPGRLVITGAPGAGKTVLALHLMLLLLTDRAPRDPVPVRLSLSTFDPNRNKLDDWLADHLIRTYRLRPAAAAALVRARLILPVLDGLDEMDASETPGLDSRAAAAVEVMNSYVHGTTKGQLVLTCRSAPYAALEGVDKWAEDASRIDITPVSLAATETFVAARTRNLARWAPVLDALRAAPASPLALGLSTPWRLTVALAVYEERHLDGRWVRDPVDLLERTLRTPEQIRDHLLNLFVLAASSAGGTTAPYTQPQVRIWLTVLARYLHTNTTSARVVAGRQLSGTDLVLHELWPLTGHRRARTVHVLLTVAVWATVDLPAALLDAWHVYATNVTLMVVAGLLIGIPPWPVPSRLRRVTVRTPAERHQLVNGLVGGLFWGVLVVAVDMGDVVGPAIGLVYGLVVGLAGGAMVGVGLAGVLSDAHEVRMSHGNASPRGMVRDDLVTGFATGLVVGLGFVPFYWFALGPVLALGAVLIYMLLFGLGGGRALALLYNRLFRCGYRGALDSLFRPWRAFGPLFRTGAGPALGAAGVRYMAFLLCTRRWWSSQPLPWRLGRFLDWCCDAGLTRTAGIAYQFRHRELQDFLIRSDIHDDPLNRPTSAQITRT